MATLPVTSISEKHLDLNENLDELVPDVASLTRNIILRNKCLEIIHTLLYNSNKNTIHIGYVG